MKPSLIPGLKHRFRYLVPESKMVPALYPEAGDFQVMPAVLATGYMVGLLEWTAIQLLAPHLDDGEGSLGTHVDFSHVAPTPAGLTVTVDAEVAAVEGRNVAFFIHAHDGVDLISEGRHRRTVVRWDRFQARVDAKRASTRVM